MKILNFFYFGRKKIKDLLGLKFPIKILFLKETGPSGIELDYIITYCIENGTILMILIIGS
jgi:hypothetical protein